MKLISYYRYSSGTMMGGRSSFTVSYTPEGRCLCESQSKSSANLPLYVTRYYADGLLEKMDSVCEKYRVYSWTDLPEAVNFGMMDGGASGTVFRFEDGTEILLGDGKLPPAESIALWEEIGALLKEAEAYGVDAGPKPSSLPEGFELQNSMLAHFYEELVYVPFGQKAAAPAPKFCSCCGNRLEPGQAFCGECGAKVN